MSELVPGRSLRCVHLRGTGGTVLACAFVRDGTAPHPRCAIDASPPEGVQSCLSCPDYNNGTVPWPPVPPPAPAHAPPPSPPLPDGTHAMTEAEVGAKLAAENLPAGGLEDEPQSQDRELSASDGASVGEQPS